MFGKTVGIIKEETYHRLSLSNFHPAISIVKTIEQILSETLMQQKLLI